jgi:hypothetical protein
MFDYTLPPEEILPPLSLLCTRSVSNFTSQPPSSEISLAKYCLEEHCLSALRGGRRCIGKRINADIHLGQTF